MKALKRAAQSDDELLQLYMRMPMRSESTGIYLRTPWRWSVNTNVTVPLGSPITGPPFHPDPPRAAPAIQGGPAISTRVTRTEPSVTPRNPRDHGLGTRCGQPQPPISSPMM
jgi:hypothetical protein